MIRFEKKSRKSSKKRNKKGKRPTQRAIVRLRGPMLLLVEEIKPAEIKSKIEANRISHRSPAEPVPRKTIILLITLNWLKQ